MTGSPSSPPPPDPPAAQPEPSVGSPRAASGRRASDSCSEHDAPVLCVESLLLQVGARTLVRDLSFRLAAGERLVIVGGNGAGKSTLLSVLAGLTKPTGGLVQRPSSPPGVLFQDGGLWPHMTVNEHLEFVDTQHDTVWRSRLLDTFRLKDLISHRPEALSGGERLRLGLARALANRPSWILLDEPLAHLDPQVVAIVRESLPMLIEEIGAASLVVTHNPDDVLHFGERLLSLSGNGPTWLGPARFALDSPPTRGLAAFAERGTLLTALSDSQGRADFGLGLAADGCPPREQITAYLDTAAVRLTDSASSIQGTYVAPDRRGGSWVRVEGRLLRCSDIGGSLHAGQHVRVHIEGRVRPLYDEEHAPSSAPVS